MKRDYLGDSYDAVKSLWQQVLAEWAPLYAEPRFVPEDLQAEFTILTGVPMLHGAPSRSYSILNDPDTGIRLPDEDNQRESRKHIALPSICEQLRRDAARTVITFDQSVYRLSGLKLDEQRRVKMRYLAASCYFPSTTSPMPHSFSYVPVRTHDSSFGAHVKLRHPGCPF